MGILEEKAMNIGDPKLHAQISSKVDSINVF